MSFYYKNSLKLFLTIFTIVVYSIDKYDCAVFQDDKVAFEAVVPDANTVFEILCHVTYDNVNDIHTFTSKIYEATDLPTALADITDVPPNDTTSPLCVLRAKNENINLSSNPTVPSYDRLKKYFRYHYFPTPYGYHPRGGFVIYYHSDYNIDTKLFTFTAKFFTSFNSAESYYTTKTTGALGTGFFESIALWGPRFRYAPVPEYSINKDNSISYYQFPRIKSINGVNSILNLEIVPLDSDDAIAHIVFQNFFNPSLYKGSEYTAIDDMILQSPQKDTDITNEDYEYTNCNDLTDDEYILISKGNRNCSYDHSTFTISCIDDAITGTIPDTISGASVDSIRFIGFCENFTTGAKYALFREIDNSP